MALSSVVALAATSVPLVLLAVTALAALVRGRAFALARAGTAASFVLAVVTAIFAWAAPPPDRLPAALGFVRTDVVTCSVLLLVTLLGWVVVVFSATYLRADKAAGRYERALLATLVAVTALVVTNHLLVLVLAWTTTSLALHVLLTHFRERTQALVAAHKKFLLGRLADVCMFAVVVVLWEATGTFDIDGICRWAALHPDSSTVRATAVLVASAVILKSAQLPFHGWLTQVMEAPTPVSALLHAGIVNIGGFVLVRFAPLVDEAPGARALLVVVGTVSAVFASLVMTTRVSIKVALAWSTCAQMGFMLVECGLGQWHLALLHLLAHSVYKAHAFLSAGNEVQRWKAFDLVRPRDEEPPPSPWLLGIQHASSVVFVAALVYAVSSHEPGGLRGAFALVVPVGLALSVAAGSVAAAPLARAGRLALRAAVFAMAVLGTHFFATKVPGVATTTTTTSALELAVVGIGFTSLAIVDVLLRCLPRAPFVATLRVQLFGGFYLDEIFTRLTFELWPPKRLPPKPDHESAVASGLTRPAFGGSACPAPSSAKVAS